MGSMFIIMGVSGSGKTTIGKMLSQKSGIPFFDADDFHSAHNVERMKKGIPLTDADRSDWLESLHHLLSTQHQSGIILACSALKNNYRNYLSRDIPNLHWIFLKGRFELVQERLSTRVGHYFDTSLLPSQYEILEEPAEALVLDIEQDPISIVSTVMSHYNLYTEFGVVGLGVMGKSLALNLANQGYKLSLYNRYIKDKEEQVAVNFIEANQTLKHAHGFENMQYFVHSLARPRKILLMVNAGSAVDRVCAELEPLIDKDDIIIDGGNSFYKDTESRILKGISAGYHFLGAGISGGEEGALKGPSIMVGGNEQAYSIIEPILKNIAAKDAQGLPCCSYISAGGSGHFVKMVHNAIEYGEMQLLTEVYEWMRKGMNMQQDAMAAIMTEWNQSSLNSYLLEITIDILRKKEDQDWLLEKIADISLSKGTGIWSVNTAAELGVPAGMFNAALNARFLSASKALRVSSAEKYALCYSPTRLPIDTLRDAYSLCRIINHVQGFELIKKAATSYKWNIDIGALARIWTNGCIIRSALMEQFKELSTDTDLMVHAIASEQVVKHIDALRNVVAEGVQTGISMPAFSEALQYIYAVTTADSSINLIQAQRDYFGSHTYKRNDDPDGESYHTDWK